MSLMPAKSYEDLLGDGLEQALAKGAKSLDEVVAVLNDANVRGPAGQVWTAPLLERELERLGE